MKKAPARRGKASTSSKRGTSTRWLDSVKLGNASLPMLASDCNDKNNCSQDCSGGEDSGTEPFAWGYDECDFSGWVVCCPGYTNYQIVNGWPGCYCCSGGEVGPIAGVFSTVVCQDGSTGWEWCSPCYHVGCNTWDYSCS